MEFLKVYVMAALPVFIAFGAIWWFMTCSVVAHLPRRASRAAAPEGGRAVVKQARWQKAA